MGRRSRTKGHSFEREIAIALRPVFPEARRQLEYHARDARGVDLQQTGHYRFQLKRFKDYAPISAIEEVQCDRVFGEVPVLVTKGDQREAMAVLPLAELIRLLSIEKKAR